MKIVFVCSGNTCRSVMAQGFLEKMQKEKKGLPGEGEKDTLEISSAGTAAFPGQPAASEALALLLKEGIDLSHHQSRQITREILQEADLVLTMTRSQLALLQERFPEFREKMQLFASYSLGEEKDIPDPYGYPGSYHMVAEEIKRIIQSLLDKMEK